MAFEGFTQQFAGVLAKHLARFATCANEQLGLDAIGTQEQEHRVASRAQCRIGSSGAFQHRLLVVLDNALDTENPHVAGTVEADALLRSDDWILLQFAQVTAVDQRAAGCQGERGVFLDLADRQRGQGRGCHGVISPAQPGRPPGPPMHRQRAMRL
ncbi:hypothetical protein D3C72_813820 [compost metagenome]